MRLACFVRREKLSFPLAHRIATGVRSKPLFTRFDKGAGGYSGANGGQRLQAGDARNIGGIANWCKRYESAPITALNETKTLEKALTDLNLNCIGSHRASKHW